MAHRGNLRLIYLNIKISFFPLFSYYKSLACRSIPCLPPWEDSSWQSFSWEIPPDRPDPHKRPPLWPFRIVPFSRRVPPRFWSASRTFSALLWGSRRCPCTRWEKRCSSSLWSCWSFPKPCPLSRIFCCCPLCWRPAPSRRRCRYCSDSVPFFWGRRQVLSKLSKMRGCCHRKNKVGENRGLRFYFKMKNLSFGRSCVPKGSGWGVAFDWWVHCLDKFRWGHCGPAGVVFTRGVYV